MADKSSKYVVRSMSTTDFDVVRGTTPEPFHIYLRRPENRATAYWSGKYEAMLFDTPHEAEAEGLRVLMNWRRTGPDDAFNVVPVDDSEIPTYWEIQELNDGFGSWFERNVAVAKRAHRLAIAAGVPQCESPHHGSLTC